MPIECGYLGAPQARQQLVDLGPHTTVSVGLDPDWRRPAASTQATEEPIPALIDTGAQESAIDKDLAVELGLPVVDKRIVAGVGRMQVDVCLAQVHVEGLRYTIEGQFALIPL